MTVLNEDDVRNALTKATKKGQGEAAAIAALNSLLADYGFPAGDKRLGVLRALTPALMLHLDGDLLPVPDRHAFIESSGEVRVSPALNSERIETASGAVLYINLRAVADAIRQKGA